MLAPTQVWAFSCCMVTGVWRYLQNSNKYHKAYTFFLLCRKKELMEIYQENGLYGLKNDCGEVLISPQYREFYPFSCGLSCVRNSSYQYAYINIFNKVVVPFGKYIWVDPQFKGGYARVKTNDNKYWGLIDTTGRIAIIPNLDYIRPLSVKPPTIKGLGACVHVNGIYSSKAVGYVIDRMSCVNLPVDFEFEDDLMI